jgi:Helix-turn-helix domain
MPSQIASKLPMLNAADAAAYCGSTASTFAKLRVTGGGPVYIKIGKRVIYDPADLDRWLAAHRRASVSDERMSENYAAALGTG